MSTVYRDDRGPLQLGKRLGQGGQGTVYEMGGEAVKIYTAAPTADQTQKIRALLTVRTATLEAVSAWPNRLVYSGNKPVGYVMPKLTNQHPIGRISLPASRKAEFPEKPWGWLIHIARNVAAAVDQIHAAGVIVGDLNDANIFVDSTSGVVKMLDVDSFQVSLNGKSWNTGVGVPMYLPPELQGRDLTTIARTKNHDTFGLAVLIFQLLMMGRHPWGGDYKSDKSIDELVATEPYAYGSAARARGLVPPPTAPKMQWLHADVSAAFERAFSGTNRPSASEWANTLDAFESALSHCTVSRIHEFVPAQGPCPWCGLEKHSGIFYFLPSSVNARQSPTSTFVIAKIEAELAAITLPENFFQSNPKHVPVSPAARPAWANRLLIASRLFAVALVLGTIVAMATYGWGVFWLGLVAFVVIYGNTTPGAIAERNKKTAERELAARQKAYDDLIAQWHAAGASAIIESHEKAKADIVKYKSLAQQQVLELQQLHAKHREIMFNLHLAKHLIRDADIGLPRTSVRSLEAYGVQTAADVKMLDTIKVPQIGQVRLQKLRDWRASLTTRFSYNPQTKLPSYMTDEVIARYDKLRRDLETQLPHQVERIRFSVNRWQDRKAINEAPIKAQADRLLEQREVVAMWEQFPKA